MLKDFISIFLTLCFAVAAPAQRKHPPLDTRKTVRIDENRPTIYLQFVRLGTCSHAASLTVLAENPCQSNRTDVRVDVFEAVWLRICNNSRWAIELKAGNLYTQFQPFTLQDKRVVVALPDGFEIDAEYGVEADQGYERIETEKGNEYKPIDVKAPYVAPFSAAAPVFLPPGRSIVFAVKREHLAKHLKIFPTYKYEWETSGNNSGFEEPRHRVYFSDYDLEKALGKN